MRQTLEERSGLSPEKIDTLCAFGQALIEKNKVMNLTAITEPQAVAELHFLDCITLLQAAEFQGKRVIDVGCGAGFPGVPLKIADTRFVDFYAGHAAILPQEHSDTLLAA